MNKTMSRNNRKQAFFMLIFGFVLLLISRGAGAAGLEADMVIYNAKILTADSPDPDHFAMAQAAAIYDGKFIAVGKNQEALQYAGPNTRKIDAGGRTVIPGLVETHHHIYKYGAHFFPEDKPRVSVTDPSFTLQWSSKADGLAQLRSLALTKKPDEWIVTVPRGEVSSGIGLVVELHKGEVTRFDLDQATPNNPVALHWGGGEAGSDSLVNTKALDLLLQRYPSIAGVHRDGQGVPTGRLSGLANWTLYYEFWPQIPAKELGPLYKLEMEENAAQGLTTISTRLHPNHLAGYAWLNARGELPARMAFSLETTNRNPNMEATMSRLVGLQGGTGKNMWGVGDEKLWIIGMALSNIDETPGSGGSCVSKPYPREAPNFPVWLHQPYGPNGLCTLSSSDYNDIDMLRSAAKYGFRVSAMHSGGDRGIESFLDAIEELSKQYPDVVERRWVIDHCRFINDEHARRAKKLGIIFSCGPKYVYPGEKGDIGAYKLIFGEKVAEDVVVPLRRLLDHGLRTTMQLDQHGFHAFLGLQVAVTRKDVTGRVWGPQQRINRREALYMYTRWGAEYVLREDMLGSIEPKKYADFAVLSQDYLTVPEDDIAMIDPVLTVMGGKITYTQPEFASSSGMPQVGFRGNPTWWKRGTAEEARKARASQ